MSQRVLLAVLLTASALFTAHMTNLMVAHALTRSITLHRVSPTVDLHPTSPVNYGELAQDILASGMFGGPETAVEHTNGYGEHGAVGNAERIVPIGPPIDAAKKVKLVGTVIGEDKISMAVIEEIGTKKQALYRLDDSIPNVGHVAQIRKDAILIRQGRQQELLGLEHAVTVVQPHVQIVGAPPAVPVNSQ